MTDKEMEIEFNEWALKNFDIYATFDCWKAARLKGHEECMGIGDVTVKQFGVDGRDA